MSALRRGVRNTFRNGVRTTSLVIIIGLSVGLALTMLVARQAINQKIADVKSSVGNTITVSPAGARGFQGGGNPLTQSQLDGVKSLAHVTAVTETLNDRLDSSTTNLVSPIDPGTLGRRFNGGQGGPGEAGTTNGSAAPTFTLPVTVTGTNSASSDALAGGAGGGGTLKLTSGKTFDASKDANVALVGSSLATKNNLSVGSTFTAYGATITVAGIFDAGNTFSNSGVIMPLSTAQRLSSQAGDVTAATVTVDSVSNLDAATSAIKAKLGTAADVTSSQDRATQAIAPLESIRNVSLVSLVGAVVAGAVIVLLTMLMIVRERRREIGILKAIGSSNAKVVAQFMSEAVTFTLLGALIGLVIGVVGASPVTHMLATSAQNSATTTPGGGPTMISGGGGAVRTFGGGRALQALGLGRDNLTALHAAVGWDILLYGLGAALAIALIGSAVPAFMISKVRPAEVMRSE